MIHGDATLMHMDLLKTGPSHSSRASVIPRAARNLSRILSRAIAYVAGVRA
jgi:hypothetical protein